MYFLSLVHIKSFLKDWMDENNDIQKEIKNKLSEWLDQEN